MACDSIHRVPTTPDSTADDIAALRAALSAAELARQEAEARATGAEAMVAHLKLLIAKLRHDRFGASSERSRKLIDQLELELGELVAAASEDAAKAENAGSNDKSAAGTTSRRQPARAAAPRSGGSHSVHSGWRARQCRRSAPHRQCGHSEPCVA